MEVMLIRHSKTAGNAQRRYIGRTDEPLSAEGIALAETVGQDLTLQKVYVTPLIPSIDKGKYGFSGLKQMLAALSSLPGDSPAASSALPAPVFAPEKLRKTCQRA